MIDIATNKEETVAALKRLKEQAEAGQLDELSIRVYKSDGSYEDIFIAGTEERRSELRAEFLNEMVMRH